MRNGLWRWRATVASRICWIGLAMAFGAPTAWAAEILGDCDFRDPSGARGWLAQHGIERLESTAEGLRVEIGGEDPYLAGPPRDYPEDRPLWLNVRLRSEAGGGAQVFFFPADSGPTEEKSVRFPVAAGDWRTVRVPFPPMGRGYRLRLDPPGDTGVCLVERIWFEARVRHAAPPWPVPVLPVVQEGDPTLGMGSLRWVHRPFEMEAWVLEVDGQRVAAGQTGGWVGYEGRDGARWITGPWTVRPIPATRGGALAWEATVADPEGAVWTVRRQVTEVPLAWRRGVLDAGTRAATFEVETSLRVSQPRSILHWPALVGFALGPSGDWSTNKQQALLAGVEYLDNEPSSSEADLVGDQARRQVADTAKLTFPLMSVVSGDRYVAMAWEMHRDVAAAFDSPDRIFRSGGHLLGLIVPGSDGLNRDEGDLLPYEGRRLEPGQSIQVRAWILAGRGSDVTAPVRHYLALRGLPEVPSTGLDATGYFRLAARGWLDSEIRDGDRFRHAVVGPFPSQPAADAAGYLAFLAGRVGDVSLAARLGALAPQALRRVPEAEWHASGVGHVRMPMVPLVYGAVEENRAAAVRNGRALLGRFEADGVVRYRAPRTGPDYGRTHWTHEANGLTAQVVQSVLENAVFSGDAGLRESGLRHLRALGRFRGTVPRGAQTWEVPLHTPDILASAHLVRAYTLGYELSGDPQFLEEARHWAWTGVPFVYLWAPGPGPVGIYATTPVLGATQWVAPNWIGLPVQWCGLVYADALYRLAALDEEGPWKRLADGITASGVQQSYPASDRRFAGLLPDSFSLRAQQRNPANINPGTLQACAVRLFGAGPMYDSRRFGKSGLRVQAAGGIFALSDAADVCSFRVEGWPSGPHRVQVHGDEGRWRIRVVGAGPVAGGANEVWDAAKGPALVTVEGRAVLEVRREG